jgi:hypothetical protein
LWALITIAMLLMTPGIEAQYSGDESDLVPGFNQEELAQMLAPIALYPDSLIARILMASTYPLEVVEAERWVRRNELVKDAALDEALQQMTWDPSVKSLCHFPDVLFAMSENLDQTRKLGDAYLVQQDEVMATIQLLRQRAREQGNLRSTSEQKVVYETRYIRIEPVDPQVVYVPVYNPLYVYGPWWYPAYPPRRWYYPPHVVVTGPRIVFGPRIYIGLGFFSWCWFDWPSRHIYVHYDRSPYFRGHHGVHRSGRHYWRHDPTHRRGVAYRDTRTSARYGRARPEPSSPNRVRRGYLAESHNKSHTRSHNTGTRETSWNKQPGSVESRGGAGITKSRGDRRRDTSYRTGTSAPSQRAARERNRTVSPTWNTAQEKSRSNTYKGSYLPSGTRVTSPGAVRKRARTATPSRNTGPEKSRSGTARTSSFEGIGKGDFERKAAQRGAESRSGGRTIYRSGNTGSSSAPRSGGGSSSGGHGGGGRRR